MVELKDAETWLVTGVDEAASAHFNSERLHVAMLESIKTPVFLYRHRPFLSFRAKGGKKWAQGGPCHCISGAKPEERSKIWSVDDLYEKPSEALHSLDSGF